MTPSKPQPLAPGAAPSLGSLADGVMATSGRLQPHALQTLAIAMEAALQEAHGSTPEVWIPWSFPPTRGCAVYSLQ